MSSTSPSGVALPQSIERFRSSIIAFGPFFVALLLWLSDMLNSGRPFGGLELINAGLALLTLVAVYFPASAWVKFAAAVGGAALQAAAAGMTDGRWTSAEAIAVAVSVVSALLVGALPNAPQTVVAEAGDDVPDVRRGSTYGGTFG